MRPVKPYAGGLAIASTIAALWLATTAMRFNTDLALAEPALSHAPPQIADPHTPRLAHRVILVIIDGLGLAHSQLPALDALRARGVAAAASAHYPTWSRPSYVAILTGVPPPASGVRTNRVPSPVPLDSLMARAQAAGLRVATASDIGFLPSLFVRGTHGDLANLEYPQSGDRSSPPAGASWPFDDVRKASDTESLAQSIESVLAGDADLVIVLAGAVDRAGHATGADSTPYATAATDVDRMLGRVLASVDLARDTIVITADHGHVGRGGHGGDEPEVAAVPLIVAGAGVRPGAATVAQLADLSPTLAALLGIAAPGHGFGRTLVELLALAPDAADRRRAADDVRVAAVAVALADVGDGPDPLALVLAIAGCTGLCATGFALRRHIKPRGIPTGVIAFAIVLGGLVALTHGRFSPSHVPTKDRLEKALALLFVVGIAAQLIAATRTRDLAAATGRALVGLVVTAGIPALVTAWFAPPYTEVPSAFWLVAIPASQLAGAGAALAIALALAVTLVRSRG